LEADAPYDLPDADAASMPRAHNRFAPDQLYRSTRPSMRRAAFALVLALSVAACPATRADVAISEQIIQLGDGLNDLRQENAVLQQQVDSLLIVVAKQDTAIRQLANLAGMPLAK